MANGIEEQYKNRTVNSCTVCWNTLRQSNLDKTSNQEYVIGSAKLCYFFTGEKLFTVTPILAYELIRWSNILYATVKTKKRVFSVSRLLACVPLTASPLTTTVVQMTLSSSFLSTHSTLTQTFLIFKTLFNRRAHTGWLLIFLLLTVLRLNACSSDSKTNLPKYTTLHLTPPTLL